MEEEEEEDLSSSSSSLLKNDEKRANADDLTIVVPPLTTTTTLFFFFFCIIVGTTLDFASFEEDGSVARIICVLFILNVFIKRACVVLFFVSKSLRSRRAFSPINSQIERE